MAEDYRIVRESAQLVYIEINGEIGLEFLHEFWAVLEESEGPLCILLRNTQDAVASMATVGLLYKSAQDPRLKAVAAFDLTSAQTLLVEWLLKAEGVETFRVFNTEQAAREYLAEVCGT